MIFTIDQNSHSLWDTLPKLQALAAAGYRVTHFVEDVDVAFTALGSGRKTQNLRLAAERFHHSGGSDWGAALFYHDFLGRQPLELRRLEPQLGMSIAALARRLQTTLEDLYAEYSTSDNHILVGPSYAGDRNHHRLIGDLSLAETDEFLRQIIRHAEQNCLHAFPDPDARERTREWFAQERCRLERLAAEVRPTMLVGLYKAWLGGHVPQPVRLDLTGSLFSLERDDPPTELLELFIRRYDLAAGLYNRAVAETHLGLHPLRIGRGELPAFAVLRFNNHLVRTGMSLQEGRLILGEREYALAPGGALPLDALRRDGVLAIVGKAIAMVLQARIGPGGRPLALPHLGSSYMPAAHRFAALLREHDLLPGSLAPLLRVRLRLLDHLGQLESTIRLPPYLAGQLGADEIPARRLGREYRDVIRAAEARLADLADDARRAAWLHTAFPRQTREIEELESQKRRLAQCNPHDPRTHELWKQVKALQTERLAGLLRQVVVDVQTSHLEFWDSRGAILPWSIALGGREFYRRLIREAEITEETHR